MVFTDLDNPLDTIQKVLVYQNLGKGGAVQSAIRCVRSENNLYRFHIRFLEEDGHWPKRASSARQG